MSKFVALSFNLVRLHLTPFLYTIKTRDTHEEPRDTKKVPRDTQKEPRYIQQVPRDTLKESEIRIIKKQMHKKNQRYA